MIFLWFCPDESRLNNKNALFRVPHSTLIILTFFICTSCLNFTEVTPVNEFRSFRSHHIHCFQLCVKIKTFWLSTVLAHQKALFTIEKLQKFFHVEIALYGRGEFFFIFCSQMYLLHWSTTQKIVNRSFHSETKSEYSKQCIKYSQDISLVSNSYLKI